MKSIFKNLAIIAALFSTFAANADDKGRLYIVGESSPKGWDLDYSRALLASPEKPSVYTGTLYLKGGDSNTFKFLQTHEYGNTEYGLPDNVTSQIVNGACTLASGTSDNGYKQLSVAQNGNYYITVDTENLTADITLSDYQDTQIEWCSLFLVGGNTPGNWTVEDATPLYQSKEEPYKFSAKVNLKADGSFKIAKTIKGGGTFDSKFYFFKDAADAGKISEDSTDDRQWSVPENGEYNVSVNTLTNAIAIQKADVSTVVEDLIGNEVENGTPVYYNLQGARVDNPSKGIYIEVIGNKARKVVL